MDNNNLNQDSNLDSLNMNNEAPLELPKENEAIVTDTTKLQYDEVLKPGEELDDFHHEHKIEEIDTKFLKTNKLAVIALINAFFVPVLPIIFEIIALIQIRKTHEGGKPLNTIAIIVNILIIAIEVVLFMFVKQIGPFEDKMKNVTDDQMRICTNLAYGCDSDEDEDGFKTCSYCKDNDCIDIVTIECPTDELIEKTQKDKENRSNLNLNQ